MRVLVVGGSGLMGAATIRHLLAAGHKPTNLARGGTVTASGGLARPPLPDGVPTLLCDRATEGPKLRRLLAEGDFDAIVDYFAMTPEHIEDVVAAFREGSSTDLRSYIFISTNMVYPGGPGGFDISPLRPLVPEGLADIAGAASAPDDYGGLKLKCEAVLQQAWQDHGFPFTTIRPPSVIGPACDVRHELLQRVAMGLPVPASRDRPLATAPEGGFRLAFSEDVASLCLAVLAAPEEKVRGESFNVAMEEALSLEDYIWACREAAPPGVAAAWPSREAAAAQLEALGPPLRSYEGQVRQSLVRSCSAH